MLRVKQGVCGLFQAKNGPCGGGRTQLSLRRPSRTGNAYSGDSEAELAERFADARGKVAGRLGDVFNAGETHDAHRQAAQGRHHVRSVFSTDLGEVFVIGGVADMVIAVFNLPMATSDAQQVFRGGSFFAHAGEAEGAIITDLTTFQVGGYALNPEGLTQMWEIYAGCPGGDGNFTVFITAVTDISRFGAEGENPPKGGMPDGCVVFAGCL